MTATEPFVTAEETTSLRPRGWVLLETFSFAADFGTYVHHFEITTHSGYRAVLNACSPECDRTPCLKASCSARTHCHYGIHIEHARAIAADVAKSYGSAEKQRSDPSRGRGHLRHPKRVPNVPVREWKESEWVRTMETLIV